MTNIAIPTGSAIPEFSFHLAVPSRSEDLAKRWHNKYAKEALRYAIEKHHEEHIPLHFKRGARERYGYAKRDPKYIRGKQRRFKQGGMDLVKSGRTRRQMTSQFRLRLGGTAANNSLTATLILRFPFRGGTGRFRNRMHGQRGRGAIITIRQMIREVEAFHRDEVPKIAAWFEEEYWRLVDNHRSTRKRVRPRGADGRFI